LDTVIVASAAGLLAGIVAFVGCYCYKQRQRQRLEGPSTPTSERKALMQYELVASSENDNSNLTDTDSRERVKVLGPDATPRRSHGAVQVVRASAVLDLQTDGLFDVEEQADELGNWLEQDDLNSTRMKKDYSTYDQ
jgi:hypothetical protein